MNEITQIIKRLRARGISQSEIARRTKISQSKLSRWEAGFVATAATEVLKIQEFEANLVGDQQRGASTNAQPAAEAAAGQGA